MICYLCENQSFSANFVYNNYSSVNGGACDKCHSRSFYDGKTKQLIYFNGESLEYKIVILSKNYYDRDKSKLYRLNTDHPFLELNVMIPLLNKSIDDTIEKYVKLGVFI